MQLTDGDLMVRCRCHDLAHTMALWFEPEERGFDLYEVSMIVPWMPWRYRLQQAWRVLRGQPGTSAFVSLEADQLPDIIAHMQAYVDHQQTRSADDAA